MRFLVAVSIVLTLAIFINNGQDEVDKNKDNVEDVITVTKSEDNHDLYPKDLATIAITVQRQYLDGRMDTETFDRTITSMEDIWYTFESYQFIDQKMGEMVFREYVDDISPYLKEVGYFGIADDQLVIFEGEPQYNQNIQMIYQLDPSLLSESDQRELTKGIRIDSKQTYQEVIDVFRQQVPSEEVSRESD